MSIYTIAPATWTNDLPVPNATTFNKEIHDRLADIDTNVADKTTAQTLTNKTLTSPQIDDIVAATVNDITITPGANKLVKIAVLRQNITTNVYNNNTVILTGWNFILAPNAAGISKTVGFGITFSAVPIITITPIGKKAGSDPTGIADFTSHGAVEAGKALSPSATGFAAHIWTTTAYDLNDRVGFMWTAIGQQN